MNLRDYQERCIVAVLLQFQTVRSTLVVMATGLGKTVIFCTIAHRWTGGRVLIVAHRDELIRQAADKVERITGERPGIEMGQEASDEGSHWKPKVVVTSVQTMSRPNRRARFNPDEFTLVIIDEAHHAPAASYRAVMEHFGQNPRCKFLGVTATPNRADEAALGQVFDSVAFDYGIEQAILDAWLVPIHQLAVRVDELDFSAVRTTAGDLNEGDLERILTEEKILHRVAVPTIEAAGDRPTLVFCTTVNHARLQAAVLDRYKPESARFLCGETPMDERREVVEAYRAGKVQFLCNCGLFLEGFDAPTTAVVVMARPTKSLPLYMQILGRGTRTLPTILDGLGEPAQRHVAIANSAKPYMTALDFVGNSGRHKIITAADALGGKFALPVREYARKNVEREGKSVPVQESLERAADELAFLKFYQEWERRRDIKAKAEWAAKSVDPFGKGGASDPHRPGQKVFEPATDKQVWKLVSLGVSRATALSFSKGQASTVIGKILRERGEAS